MLIGDNQPQLKEWKNSIYLYEKAKRTKKPFGKEFKSQNLYVSQAQIKKKDLIFHPVLQTYSDPITDINAIKKQQKKRQTSLVKHENTKKYDRNFDIINLCGQPEIKKQTTLKNKAPVRNLYNPINNNPLPQYYFKGRDIMLPINHQFKSLNKKKRQFNIVTGQYLQNNEDKKQKQIIEEKKKIKKKYEKDHVYDKVFGRYYDLNKQQQYNKLMTQTQLIHGKDYDKRFPPSYKMRQPFISDPSKPLPQAVISIDQKKKNAKKRFKMKYIVEEDYARRNLQDEIKKQITIKNRIHNSHVMQLKAKQFDIINLKKYQSSRAEKLLEKQCINSTWNILMNDSDNLPIKSAGFN